MIRIYTGKTGSGKTFQMVRDIYPLWRNGVDIYSNTFLCFEKFGGQSGCNIKDSPKSFSFMEKVSNKTMEYTAKIFKRQYEPFRRGKIVYFEDITEILEARDGIICMDEGQNLLEARNWESLPVEFSNKLRQHRKHNLDLYTTTQNIGTIDKNLRRLVQYWKHCTDVFAIFGRRNPSILTIHSVEWKDIDELYGNPEDVAVTTLKKSFFIIHFLKRRLYDTLYDIGFTAYKSVWLKQKNREIALIMPKKWTTSNARTQLLLMKYFLDQSK